MVDGFFQKAKEFFTGSNNDEFEQDTDYSDREVSQASEDDYVTPEEQIYGGLSPTSQSPDGDSADEYSNLSPASEDPYGDPANEYGR
ncbi:hypothetical protein [Nostoc sp. PCC 7107]|uniref:hypothetical protein n=1 Tax=Nostoc sp. PCC 7107 TaxID=317936 RepID=UPI00029ECEE5|nr:hypothetical protein [Nostoc sp. PCC 7107]AFY41582.1 translation initiation factor [Nostoc sp. PCC 7107]